MKNKSVKFTSILASDLHTHNKDENGVRHPIKLENSNKLLDNIKKNLPHKNSFVFIANNPNTFEQNDTSAEIRFKSFAMSGFKFKEMVVLDNRNAKDAKSIIENASLIILMGGKIIRQMKFFKQIKLKKLLRNYNGIVIGLSAGTMNQCKHVLNFPEELADLGQPLVTKGLGFFDEYIIPHCDGKTYLYEYEGIKVLEDYALPFSFKHDILAIPDGSYILFNRGGYKMHGDCYLLRKGEIYKKL